MEKIFTLFQKRKPLCYFGSEKERILSTFDFEQWVQDIILEVKGSYIIQKYIHTRTKADEPYHFRAHVQKNGEGKWQLTHIYPRIGSKKQI